MVTWNDYLPTKTKGRPFAAQMMDHELYYLSEAIEKEFTLPDGTILDLEISRLHWIWYERLCEKSMYFEEIITRDMQRLVDHNPDSASCDFEYLIEKEIYDRWETGRDPYLTSDQADEKNRAMSVFMRRMHGEEKCDLILPMDTDKKSE